MSKPEERQPVPGSLMLLVTDNLDGDLGAETQVVGPFASRKAAVDWIRETARETFDPSLDVDEEGRHPDWGSFHVLVEVKEVLRPVPSVRVSMSVETTELPPFGTVNTEENE